MADFNFGRAGASIEAGRHANANIDFGPVDSSAQINFLDHNFTNFVANSDRIFTMSGSSVDFVWGQRWANSTSRVGK